MFKKMRNILIWIYSVPINYKVFPKKIAKKLPLRLGYRTKCAGLYRGCIEIKSDNIYKGMIQIGMKGSVARENGKKSIVYMEKNGKIVFYGKADFVDSVSIRVYENALCEIGDNFFSNANFSLDVNKRVKIGKNALLGWDDQMIDSDGHDIRNSESNLMNTDKEIEIGDDVWIGAKSNILKGSGVSNKSMVGFGSLVTKHFQEENVIIAGFPAKVVKKGITWSRVKTKSEM